MPLPFTPRLIRWGESINRPLRQPNFCISIKNANYSVMIWCHKRDLFYGNILIETHHDWVERVFLSNENNENYFAFFGKATTTHKHKGLAHLNIWRGEAYRKYKQKWVGKMDGRTWFLVGHFLCSLDAHAHAPGTEWMKIHFIRHSHRRWKLFPLPQIQIHSHPLPSYPLLFIDSKCANFAGFSLLRDKIVPGSLGPNQAGWTWSREM
jgi:hypothetical protein